MCYIDARGLGPLAASQFLCFSLETLLGKPIRILRGKPLLGKKSIRHVAEHTHNPGAIVHSFVKLYMIPPTFLVVFPGFGDEFLKVSWFSEVLL